MADQLFPVPFRDDTVVLVDHNGAPFVAMRPIVDNIGLDWPTQYTKLAEKFGSTVGIIPAVAEDGRLREMLCLPLRKLPAWLYSINPNKVAPELRDKIVAYQDECEEVLWQYWTNGAAARSPAPEQTPLKERLAVLQQGQKLLQQLERCESGFVREALLVQLRYAHDLLGLPVPVDTAGELYSPLLPALARVVMAEHYGRLAVRHSAEEDAQGPVLWVRPSELYQWLAMPELGSERAFSKALREQGLVRPDVAERKLGGERVSNLAGLRLDVIQALVPDAMLAAAAEEVKP